MVLSGSLRPGPAQHHTISGESTSGLTPRSDHRGDPDPRGWPTASSDRGELVPAYVRASGFLGLQQERLEFHSQLMAVQIANHTERMHSCDPDALLRATLDLTQGR